MVLLQVAIAVAIAVAVAIAIAIGVAAVIDCCFVHVMIDCMLYFCIVTDYQRSGSRSRSRSRARSRNRRSGGDCFFVHVMITVTMIACYIFVLLQITISIKVATPGIGEVRHSCFVHAIDFMFLLFFADVRGVVHGGSGVTIVYGGVC